MSAVRNQVGPIAFLCSEQIDLLAFKVAGDQIGCKRLRAALRQIRDEFFKDPEHFKFNSSANVGLQASDLKENIEEILNILKGKSKNYPFPVHVLDINGEPCRNLTDLELIEIKKSVCSSVAIKVGTMIKELNEKGVSLVKEMSKLSLDKKLVRTQFERAIANAKERRALKSIKAGALQLVTCNGMELENLDPIFQNNKDVVLAAVKQNGKALQFAHNRLKNDNEVVTASVTQTEAALEYAGAVFKENRESVLEAIRVNGVLYCGKDEPVEDWAFIVEAARSDPSVLCLLDETLKNNKEFVLFALETTAYAFGYINEELRNDREFILEAIIKNPHLFQYVAEAFKNNREFVLAVIKRNSYAFQYVDILFRNDKEVVLVAVDIRGMALQHASEELRGDEEVVITAVTNDGWALEYASEELRNNRRVVLRAISRHRHPLRYASEELRRDVEIRLLARPRVL